MIEKITKTDVMRREANKGLMLTYIHDDLFNRAALAALDVRKSFVFYDGDKLFKEATNAMPTDTMLEKLAEVSSIRYWSKGIV